MKSNLDKFFKTNDDLEKNGVWFDISDDIGFLVRRFSASNPRVRAAMATNYKPYARQIEMGTMEIKKNLEIMVKLFLDICLADWKGVEIDGKITEYKDIKREDAIKFFMGLPDLFDALWTHANSGVNYKEDVGNSSGVI